MNPALSYVEAPSLAFNLKPMSTTEAGGLLKWTFSHRCLKVGEGFSHRWVKVGEGFSHRWVKVDLSVPARSLRPTAAALRSRSRVRPEQLARQAIPTAPKATNLNPTF